MVVVVVVPDPQAGRNIMSVNNPPSSNPISNRRRPEILPPSPTPSSASPDTGSKVAQSGIPGPLRCRNSVVVVTRAVVLMINCELCAPVLRLGIGLLLPGKQVDPVGRPLPQAIETLSGNPLVELGVTVAV